MEEREFEYRDESTKKSILWNIRKKRHLCREKKFCFLAKPFFKELMLSIAMLIQKTMSVDTVEKEFEDQHESI